MKKQTRNKYNIHVCMFVFVLFVCICQRVFIFPRFMQVFNCLPTQCPHGHGEGVVKQKVDRRGQGKGF